MSQQPPKLEVLGKGITKSVEHGGSHEAHAVHRAAIAGDVKTTIAVTGTNVSAKKSSAPAASEASTNGPHPMHRPHSKSPSRVATTTTTAADTLKQGLGSTTTAVGGTAVPRASTAVELSLVRNLKQQIACLEAQLQVARQQQEAAARSHPRKGGKSSGAAAGASTEDATPVAEERERWARGVALPLPHTVRVRHVDAMAGNDTCEVEVARLRRLPEAYAVERSALQHNVESLTKDIEGLQSLVLTVGRERDVMAAEVVQFRGALRDSAVEHAAMAAECAASLQLAEAERALRRAAEDDAAAYAKGRPIAGAPNSTDLATADAVSQRDYYKLQSDRFRGSVVREKARAEALAAALLQERNRSSTLEKQLCSALDRVGLMEGREEQLAAYYQSLSARFVTLSALLRHVLDVVPEELLHEQRVPSPERAGDAVTLGEVRETLAVWQEDVVANAAQLTTSSVAAAAAAETEDAGGVGDATPHRGTAPDANFSFPAPQTEVGTPHSAAAACGFAAGPLTEGAEHGDVAAPAEALGNDSVASAPDMMAVATVATITQVRDDVEDVMEPVEKAEKMEKGVLAAAQEYGEAHEAEPDSTVNETNGWVDPSPYAEASEASHESPPALYAGSAPGNVECPYHNGGGATAAAEAKDAGDAPDAASLAPPDVESAVTTGASPVKAGTAAVPSQSPDVTDDVALRSPDQPEALEEAAATPPAMEESAPVGEPDSETPEAPLDASPPAVDNVSEARQEEEEACHGAAAAVPPAAPVATAPEPSSEEEDGEAESAVAAAAPVTVSPPSPPVEEAAVEATPPPAVETDNEVVVTPADAPSEAKQGEQPSQDPASASASVVEDVDIADMCDTAAAAEAVASGEEKAAPTDAAAASPSSPPLPPLVAVVSSPPPPPPAPPVFAVPPPPPAVVAPVPPPPAASVPVPMPLPSLPAGVAVPLPPGAVPVQLPMAVVPTGTAAPPAAPAPPTLEAQLSQLDARIESQNASLAELVQRHKEPA